MKVNSENTEIRDQVHLMDAEGICDEQPDEIDVQSYLAEKGWQADEIDIWFDNSQSFWRWNCNIETLKA